MTNWESFKISMETLLYFSDLPMKVLADIKTIMKKLELLKVGTRQMPKVLAMSVRSLMLFGTGQILL